MSHRPTLGRAFAVVTLTWAGAAFGGTGPSSFRFIRELPGRLPRGEVVVDARPLRECERRTIAGAYCLPAVDLLGPHGRLISFRNIFWRLGSAGLGGSETAIVASDRPEVRAFVGGVLYLAGQKTVEILDIPITGHAGVTHAQLGPPGHVPAPTRNPVFEARVRGRLIVLRADLARALRRKHPPSLLDGRSLKQYWGVVIRAQRGGHIPGAQPFPAIDVQSELDHGQLQAPQLGHPVAYANGPFSSIVYFTLLRAGLGVPARVYIDGWRAWASDGALPVDAMTLLATTSSNIPSALRAPGQVRRDGGGWSLSDLRVVGWLLGAAVLLISAAVWVRFRVRNGERSGDGAK